MILVASSAEHHICSLASREPALPAKLHAILSYCDMEKSFLISRSLKHKS